RQLKDEDVCFVGIGLPSAAASLARLTHAPEIVLIYESGTIGAEPDVLPLSIGDGELADTALTVISVPEIFRYWLQGGRVDVGFLGAAQIDRYANINTTVVGVRKSKSAVAGSGRSAGNCGASRPSLHHTTSEPKGLRRQARFHHIGRLPRRGRRTGAFGSSRSGADKGHHRPRRHDPRSDDARTDPDAASSRRHR